jgi:hypothetical protein
MASADDYWVSLVRPLVAGRRVVFGGGPLAGATRQVRLVRELGATSCLVVAGGLGTGDLPGDEDCEWILVEVGAPDVIGDVIGEARRWEALSVDPPAELVDALDRFDPDRSALVWFPPFQAVQELCGRPVHGARRREWIALEDKTIIDASWDRWGIVHPPCEVVDVNDPIALVAARAGLDVGAGTVWSGDAREGFNGGAVFVRWVRSDRQADAARAFFSPHCDQVRIAPFVEGLPCSIHGMVFDEYVAVFRPVELIVLRSPTAGLVYAGTATYWDPPTADRVAMRAAARVVGAALRDEVAFRGAFTIDGILSDHGFVATELNPRFGAGLAPIAGETAGLLFVQRALVAGTALDYRPQQLEQSVVARADAHRGGAAYLPVPRDIAETQSFGLASAGGWRLAEPGEERDALLELGPSASGPGGFVRVRPEPSRTPNGPSLANRVSEMLAFADREFKLDLGKLRAAMHDPERQVGA